MSTNMESTQICNGHEIIVKIVRVVMITKFQYVQTYSHTVKLNSYCCINCRWRCYQVVPMKSQYDKSRILTYLKYLKLRNNFDKLQDKSERYQIQTIE